MAYIPTVSVAPLIYGMFLCALARLFNFTSRPASPLLYFTDSLFNQAIINLCPRLKALYVPPLLWGSSGHIQTFLFGKVGRVNCPMPVGKRHSVVVSDGATVTFDVFEPTSSHSLNEDCTLVVCPGIANTSESIYIRTFVHHAQLCGYRVTCLNHLGSIDGETLTAPRIFTYGGTDEYSLMVNKVRALYPDTRMIAVGFSMGANIVIKYLGEEPCRQEAFAGAVSCCQGYDILEMEPYIQSWKRFRRFYDWSITKHQMGILRKHEHMLFGAEAEKRYGRFELDKIYDATSLKHIDSCYSYKRAGFSSCEEYYRQSSSRYYINKINIPVLLVNAMDDPLVPREIHYVPRHFALSRSNVIFVVTKHGGHLGFFEGGFVVPNNTTWLDRIVVDYCNALLQVSSADDVDSDQSDILSNRNISEKTDIVSNGIERNGLAAASH